MYCCSMCSEFAALKFSKILNHIRLIHVAEPNFRVSCGIEKCPATYTNFESFRSHVNRKHKSVLNWSFAKSRHNEDPENVDTEREATCSSEREILDFDDDEIQEMTDHKNEEDQLKRCSAKFILKIREELNLSQTAVQQIVANVETLFEKRDRIAELSSAENAKKIRKSPFSGLESRVQQENYFRDNFPYLVK